MRALLAIERRMQDLERKFDNNQRFGKVTAVKYEKDRWYVKLNDGDDQTPSGGSGAPADAMGGEGTFKSDWQPWQSHSHESIKFSVPPKVGQQALIRSVNGTPELSSVEPFHYGPQAPSPHGKQDETVGLIHEKDKQQHWTRSTKDTHHVIIKSKQQTGTTGLGDISGLGDLAHIGQMAGLNGSAFSSILGNLGGLNLGALGNIADLKSLGNLATLDVSNIANLSKLANFTSLSNLSGIASLGAAAKSAGLPDLAQLGNLQSIGSQVSQANLGGSVGSMIGGGSGGAAGIPPSLGGQTNTQQAEAPKLPDVPGEGDDGVTQHKTTKDFILKTVGKNKSFYKQDGDTVHIRFGEQGKMADLLMDQGQVKVQFKDKKAMVKWTENDLTTQMGEDDKSKVVMTEDTITMTQGGNSASKVVVTKNDLTISQGSNTTWKMSDGKIEIGIGGTTWKLDAAGWQQTGGGIGHDGKSIDSTHKHDGVEPGGGLTGPPSDAFTGV
jgi:hypothetical protein